VPVVGCHRAYIKPACMGFLHNLHIALQDLSRLRQLAAVRGLVSTELRARLWPVLVGGAGAHASLPSPTKAPDSHPLGRRHSTEGRASPAHSPAHTSAAEAQPEPPAPSSAVSNEYAEWSEGQHKDRGTVSGHTLESCSARSSKLLQHRSPPNCSCLCTGVWCVCEARCRMR
jgi:hypothetical protein